MQQQSKNNETLILRMDGYSSDGAAVSRLSDGRVIFVKGALRGERCEVQLLKSGKSAAWGRVSNVLDASPARQESDCPYYPKCGGCQLRHLTYEEELHFKKDRVQEALRRIGGSTVEVSHIHSAPDTLRYRNKLQFPVAPAPDGKVSIGFFRSRSHEVIDVADCLLQPEAGSRLRAAVKDWMQRFDVSAYDERAHRGLVRHLYIRTNRAGQSLCVLVLNGTKIPYEAELLAQLRAAEPRMIGLTLSVNREKTNVILGSKLHHIWGESILEDTLCSLRFQLSPLSFYQVNTEQTERLYARAIALADLQGTETVLDLYCGIGTITLAMAARAGRVIGAEVIEAAVKDARENAVRNGITNAEFLCADAADAAASLATRGLRPEVICVDPPRKGLAATVIDEIVRMQPTRILYISCDPGTLGRDVKLFAAQGYQAVRAEAFDLFPRTVHVESVVCLVRKD